VLKNTECIYARNAKLWGSRDWDDALSFEGACKGKRGEEERGREGERERERGENEEKREKRGEKRKKRRNQNTKLVLLDNVTRSAGALAACILHSRQGLDELHDLLLPRKGEPWKDLILFFDKMKDVRKLAAECGETGGSKNGFTALWGLWFE